MVHDEYPFRGGVGGDGRAEMETLRDFGIRLFQGYFFARPAFEAVAEINQEGFTST